MKPTPTSKSANTPINNFRPGVVPDQDLNNARISRFRGPREPLRPPTSKGLADLLDRGLNNARISNFRDPLESLDSPTSKGLADLLDRCLNDASISRFGAQRRQNQPFRGPLESLDTPTSKGLAFVLLDRCLNNARISNCRGPLESRDTPTSKGLAFCSIGHSTTPESATFGALWSHFGPLLRKACRTGDLNNARISNFQASRALWSHFGPLPRKGQSLGSHYSLEHTSRSGLLTTGKSATFGATCATSGSPCEQGSRADVGTRVTG